MKAKIKFLGILELLSIFERKNEVELEFDGATVQDLLHHLFLKIDPQKKRIFHDGRGKIKPELVVFINGSVTSNMNWLSYTLQDGDFIEISLASGG